MVGVIRWQVSAGEEAVVMAGVIKWEGEGGKGRLAFNGTHHKIFVQPNTSCYTNAQYYFSQVLL